MPAVPADSRTAPFGSRESGFMKGLDPSGANREYRGGMAPNPTDEDQLVTRAVNGDEAAFGRLFALYESRLRRRVEARLSPGVRRRISAQDVLQEAYLVAFDRIGEFQNRGDGAFGRWLGKIVELKAKHAVRRHVGVAKRAISGEVTRAHRGTIQNVRGRSDSPSQVAMGEELRDRAKKAIQRLPETYREVIQFIQGEGLSK